MSRSDAAPAKALYEVVEPVRQIVPFIYNSPHSGRDYPPDFLAASRLDPQAIRRSEDSFVDDLFLPVVALGAPLMRAHFPRAWLDVNREPYELDPKMFLGPLPPYANIRSIRVAGGLGTIARIVSDTEEIYARPLRVDEGLARIDSVYMPYHRMLRRLMATTHANFGCAVLIDCHSMPSAVRGGSARGRPDFVLGDRHGASCAPELVEAAVHFLNARGYQVSRNKPYAGGFITEHYGQPQRGLHALQVEVNRGLYLDERRLEKTTGFAALSSDLVALAAYLATIDFGTAAAREAAE